MRPSIFLVSLLAACAQQPPAPTPATTAAPAPAAAPAAPAPETMQAPKAGARVFFIEPLAGSTVASPVAIKMGVEGMTVAPAGTVAPDTGHHHLIVDGKAGALGEVVPADDTHIHFGKGQTETTLVLAPGGHTLTLQFADGMHRSYGPELSSTIQLTVSGATAGSGSGSGAATTTTTTTTTTTSPPPPPATGGK
jgi:3-oxoacyl-ACP reductase-like protein